MTHDAVTSKLEIIRQNLERLAQLPQASYEDFASDFRNLDSALHRLQTTIQALIDLASYIVSGARQALGRGLLVAAPSRSYSAGAGASEGAAAAAPFVTEAPFSAPLPPEPLAGVAPGAGGLGASSVRASFSI